MPQRRPRFQLSGEMNKEKVAQLNEMLEELYSLVNISGSHHLIDSTVHSDTREDPEVATVRRGDLVTGQRTPEGADRIKWQRLAVGADGTVLRSDGVDPQWDKVDLTTDVDDVLPVENGGTGNSSLTEHAVLLGNGTDPIATVSGLGDAGQVLTSNGAGADPTWEDAGGGSSAGGHLHGLQRVLGDGATTTFNLLDVAEYLEHIGVNGAFRDPATFTLSADGSQVTFDTAPGAGEVIALEYVIASL